MVLVSYLTAPGPVEATIMSSLPDNVRASCRATSDLAATCSLKDRTVVLYKLHSTVTKAQEDVRNGEPVEPLGNPCPPLIRPTAVAPYVVCRYAVGPDKGLAMFGYVEKGTHRYYIFRWVADGEPRLRGEMSTAHAEQQDWTTLQADWTRLVKAS